MSESASVSHLNSEPLAHAPRGYWELVVTQFKKNRVAVVCVWTILVLFVLAAWAPVLANGKPFMWRQDGKTSYPLLQELVAPTSSMSIDYVFNYVFFCSVTLSLAVLLRGVVGSITGRRGAWKKYILGGTIAALLPFMDVSAGFPFVRHWRQDRRPYQMQTERLDSVKGDRAIFSIVSQDPITPTSNALGKPDSRNWLGTDDQGRDVLARMLHGARISLSVGFVSEGLAILLGIFFGALAGYYRGWVDIAISRFIEIIICFPTFFLILVIISYIEPENRSIFHIMVIIGVTTWTGIARLVRGEFLKLNEMDFVQSARALGVRPLRLMFRHMLPNALDPVLVSAAFGVAGAILTESTLSYLGFGAPPPTPTWGEMISQGNQHLAEAWWLIVYPGISIFLTVTVYNLAGDGLRDAMDPKMRR